MGNQPQQKSDFGRAIQWAFGFMAANVIVVVVIIVLIVLACCGCFIGAGLLGSLQ